MITPNKIWQYFIMDAQNMSCALTDGIVTKLVIPTPLQYAPDGWKNMEIAFGTNDKYFNLARTFSLPLKFIRDGAEILRYMVNNGRGFEEELYLVVMRWDRETGNYTQEYRGRLDFSQYEDDPTSGVSANAIEGGILQFLNANEGTDYDILCDETALDIEQVNFTGINLACTCEFGIIDIGVQGASASDPLDPKYTNHIIPLTFLTKEGDSAGVIIGSQSFDLFGEMANLVSNANYLLQSGDAPTHFTVAGTLNGRSRFSSIMPSMDVIYFLYYVMVDITAGTVGPRVAIGNYGKNVTSDKWVYGKIDIALDMILPANNKIFIYGYVQGVDSVQWQFYDNDVVVKIDSVMADTTSFALRPLALLKAIVEKMTDGKYTAESNFFSANDHLLATCGDAIRNTVKGFGFPLENYLLTTSFADFFASYNSVYNLGLKVIDNILWIEPKADLYGDDNQIMDLGDVTDIKVSTANQYIANRVLCGFPKQDYDQNSGKYEFNSEKSYQLPVTVAKKDYNITSKYRGDAIGIEIIRAKLSGQDNTDNTGDKQAFLIDTMNAAHADTFSATAFFLVLSQIGFDDKTLMDRFRVGDVISITGSASNNLSGAVITSITPGGIPTTHEFFITVDQDLIPEDGANVNFTLSGTRIVLNRPNYTPITGVLDNTVFNTTISPKRQLLAHGNYLHGILLQQAGQSIKFLTGDKNIGLATTLDGITITEAGPELVSDLPAPLFLPYELKFKSKVPYRFVDIMSNVGKGYLKLKYRGFDLYCLPIGSMKARPAISSVQEWTLLVAPKTDLSTLFRLNENGQFFFNMENSIYISDLNPLHLVKYDYKVPGKYHETGMYNQWLSERVTRWATEAKYTQIWQQGDSIDLQFIANSTSNIVIKVYSCLLGFVQTIAMTEALNPIVQAPNRLLQASINTSGLEEGTYTAIIYSDDKPICISEPFSIAEDEPNTLLFEYGNSYNLIDAFFSGWNPSIRIDAFWSRVTPTSDLEDYQDEYGNFEILSGTATHTKKLVLGSVYGIPDWLILKLNKIFLLNELKIDGEGYTRNADSKFQANETEGNPLAYYDIEMAPVTDPGLEIPKTQTSTMIYYGTLPTSADPTIADKFFLGNPEGDIIIDFGFNQAAFYWFFIPDGFGLKTNWQDLNQPLMTGTIDQPGDLFMSKDFTINSIQGKLYKAQWITEFNNNPTTRIKAF